MRRSQEPIMNEQEKLPSFRLDAHYRMKYIYE